MGLRSSLGANEQYVRNIQDATGWMDSTESALDSISGFVEPRAHAACCRARPTPPTPTSRKAIATELDADHRGHQAERERQLRRQVHHGRHGDRDAAVPARRQRRLPGRRGRPGPGDPGHRARDRPGRDDDDQHGRARVPRRRPGRRRRQAAAHAARRPRPPQRQRRRRAARPTARRCRATSTSCSASAPATARRRTASRPRRRAWTRSAWRSRTQLSNTEDADIAKTLIEFNSQSAAYQAALRAGANIVQSSLMDFLR